MKTILEIIKPLRKGIEFRLMGMGMQLSYEDIIESEQLTFKMSQSSNSMLQSLGKRIIEKNLLKRSRLKKNLLKKSLLKRSRLKRSQLKRSLPMIMSLILLPVFLMQKIFIQKTRDIKLRSKSKKNIGISINLMLLESLLER